MNRDYLKVLENFFDGVDVICDSDKDATSNDFRALTDEVRRMVKAVNT